MSSSGLRDVVEQRRPNAAVGWLVVGSLVAVAAGEIVAGEVVWGVFVLVAAAVALVPPVAFRDATAMLPWEVLVLTALPAIGRVAVAGQRVDGMTFTGRVTTYVAVAAIALVVAVEMDVFTPVRMNHTFAVVFVTITTVAAAGVWAVLRFASDTLLGTTFLLDSRPDAVVESALMWDFVAATVAGVAAGFLFEYYFRRHTDLAARIPEGVGRT
ncbi:hypothetical protein [Candidatus Halobonum tyrrellensis]|uniref:Uncharacterized protein n=1 Tax=Candidatus Halobonum tyrrellensis G22 TaxID=1324957 RepID=V4GP39_9EURY|nr:hypothetical protein [Candidatus Halobonum tyrrellensis]ESP87161.1 hypothetical protein K933_15570 [Candidatus Halobonum tyrrellensis G22]